MSTPSEPPDDAPLDEAHLARLRAELDNGDPDDDPIVELLAEFERNSARLASQLSDRSVAGDDRALAAIAHQLVGTSSWIGAARLTAHARAIEYAALDGRKDDAQRHISAALAELQRVHQAIAERGHR